MERAELELLARLAGGVHNLVAVQSPSFKKLGQPLEAYTAAELHDLILAEPRMLRRPLLVTDDDRLLVGKKAIQAM
jgi:arsenate reductase-like glutaredoxin family protein